MATFGAGGATTSYEEFEHTDVIICWGSNTMECHPIIYNHMRRGIKNGAKMVVIDPRKIDQVKKADKWLGLNVGTDICLANAMGHVIIEEDLYDKEFVERATKGFEAYKEKVAGYTPEYAEQITGVPADDIREVARMYATADKATLNWTLGITEHHNGADGVFALIDLGLLTGHVGKYGSGLNPLRGQNNVQGGGDMGALPDKKVGGWRWDDPEAHTLFEDVWGTPLPAHEGLNQAEMMNAVSNGEIRCMYVIGENPVQSDADEHKHERLFGSLDFLVVQDILMTKTARMADVVLPAAASWAETDGTVINSERRVQRVRKAVEPPGEARDDIMILRDIARRMGYDWDFETAEEVWEEVRLLAPKFSAASATSGWRSTAASSGPAWTGASRRSRTTPPKSSSWRARKAPRTPRAGPSRPTWSRSRVPAPCSCTRNCGPKRSRTGFPSRPLTTKVRSRCRTKSFPTS